MFLGINYALSQKKIFSAYAIFKLDSQDKQEVSKISSISAIAMNAPRPSKLFTVKENVMSRVFIEVINEKVDLQSDPYFNNFNPHAVEAPWRVYIKKLIGIQGRSINREDKIWESIQLNFIKNVDLQITKAQNLRITVKHSDPKRAAFIANKIMDVIISKAEKKNADKLENQIAYLSLKLADALQDIDDLQEELNSFTINNTIMPKEIFASASAKYVSTKLKYDNNNKLYNATYDLERLVYSNQTTNNDYELLSQNHPVVNELEFRRIFGQSELINEWTWPNHTSVKEVLKIFNERKIRLKSSLNVAQAKADSAAKSFDKYIELERKLKYGNATYTVLLEQVKANSLNAGYQPNENEIFQYASTPINAASPNRKLILSLSIMLGLITGLIGSLILSISRKVYFSDSLLILHSNSKQHKKLRKLKRFRKINLQFFNKIKEAKFLLFFQEMLIGFNNSNKKFILVSSLNSSFKAENFGALLAYALTINEKNIAILNFSQNKNLPSSVDKIKNEFFSHQKINEQVTQLIPINCPNPISILTKRDAVSKLISLKTNFDVIIISADKNDTLSLVQSFNANDIFHIGLAKRKHTKRKDLDKIKLLPLDVLLHD